QCALAYLHSPVAIRERCQQVLGLACTDCLLHFAYHPDRLADSVLYVITVIRETYPTLTIPWHSRWRHFGVGGVDRLAQLAECLGTLDAMEQARCRFELVTTSVLLDAGAGGDWHYYEAATGQTYTRSEGLAVASFHMFLTGLFSSRKGAPWQADAQGLQSVTAARLGEALQATAANPLVGLEGRVALLRRLGEVVASTPHYFGTVAPRLGNLLDALCASAIQGVLSARRLLLAVLDSLSPIWPGRLTLGGVNLGDVWQHQQVHGDGLTTGLVPFHKLSQWLTYSLIEPLAEAGVRVEGSDELTGLAEYRNGGLLLDLGVLTPKHDGVLGGVHRPDSEVVVEWRALTVALLDCLADQVRASLGLSLQDLPLAKVLEGGTWRAGRQIARERRANGSPPLHLLSDGTVF
ncbi:MAG TPA: URC4/urg3 family protein, partial [Candidatus Tectomicrobia bacterium]